MLDQLAKQQFLNLETFRKNGLGVKTPVWFVDSPNSDKIFVRTIASSGKVKRIRNNRKVNIAPCKADGALLSGWYSAQAIEVMDESVNRSVDRLLDNKYGLMKKMFALVSAIQGHKYIVIEVQIEGNK